MELALALTVATILADDAVSATVSKMIYNVSLHHTQPTINQFTREGFLHNDGQIFSKYAEICVFQ